MTRHAIFQDRQAGHFHGADDVAGNFNRRLFEHLLEFGDEDRTARLSHAESIGCDEQRVFDVGHRRNVDPDHVSAPGLRVERRLGEQRRRYVNNHQGVRLGFQFGLEHLHLPLRIERRWTARPNADLAAQILGGSVSAGKNFSAPFSGRKRLHDGYGHLVLWRGGGGHDCHRHHYGAAQHCDF